jgi:hypothetical protein
MMLFEQCRGTDNYYYRQSSQQDGFFLQLEMSSKLIQNRTKLVYFIESLIENTKGIVVCPMFVYKLYELTEQDFTTYNVLLSLNNIEDYFYIKLIFGEYITSFGYMEGKNIMQRYQPVNSLEEILEIHPNAKITIES